MVRLPVPSDKTSLKENSIEEVELKDGLTESVKLDLSAQKDYIGWFSTLQKTKEWEHYQETLAVFEASKSFEVKSPHELGLVLSQPSESLSVRRTALKDIYHESEKMLLSRILDKTNETSKTNILSRFFDKEEASAIFSCMFGFIGAIPLAIGLAAADPVTALVGTAFIGAAMVLAIPMIKMKGEVSKMLQNREKITALATTKKDVAFSIVDLSCAETKLAQMEYVLESLDEVIEVDSKKMPSFLGDSTQSSIHNTLRNLVEPIYGVEKGVLGLRQLCAMSDWHRATKSLISKGYDLVFEMNLCLEVEQRLRKLSKSIPAPPPLTAFEDSNNLDTVIIRRSPGAPK